MLSKKDIYKYIHNKNASYCPYCQSEDSLYFSSIEIEQNQAYQDVSCHNCGKMWADVYILTTIAEIEED
jgi:hypothetical protein